jgi:hypothetical protein
MHPKFKCWKAKMITESLNKEKHVLCFLLKELMGNSGKKWAYTLLRNLGNKTPSETKLMKVWLGTEIAFMWFWLNLHKLTATLECDKYNVMAKKVWLQDECVSVPHG